MATLCDPLSIDSRNIAKITANMMEETVMSVLRLLRQIFRQASFRYMLFSGSVVQLFSCSVCQGVSGSMFISRVPPSKGDRGMTQNPPFNYTFYISNVLRNFFICKS